LSVSDGRKPAAGIRKCILMNREINKTADRIKLIKNMLKIKIFNILLEAV
jgi:hypothetical protein